MDLIIINIVKRTPWGVADFYFLQKNIYYFIKLILRVSFISWSEEQNAFERENPLACWGLMFLIRPNGLRPRSIPHKAGHSSKQ